MKKLLFFDCETTGLDPKLNDIIQFAYIIDIDGEVKEEGNIFMQPFSYDNVSQKALDINRSTIDKIKTYQSSYDGYKQIINVFNKYIDKYDKNDRFSPAGYNVGFDREFLQQFFLKHNNKFCWGYVDYNAIDPMPILRMLTLKGSLKMSNHKLITACENFKIPINTHDALSDIRATRELAYKLMEDYLK